MRKLDVQNILNILNILSLKLINKIIPYPSAWKREYGSYKKKQKEFKWRFKHKYKNLTKF